MATAYKGTHLGERHPTTQTNQNIRDKNLSKSDDEEQDVQQIIDMALLEMNNGYYDKAISLLDKAKELYGSSRAEELQELIIKLQTNAFKTNETKTNNDSNPSCVRQRNRFHSEDKNSTEEFKFQNDYTSEQFNLVKKINNCKNYYQVLSVTHEASDSEIKKAYKKLALHLHPDKNRAPGAAEAFKRLGNAVAMLTDAKKRKEYDLSSNDSAPRNTKPFNFYESTSSHQEYYGHHQHYYHSTADTSHRRSEEFTADELFHMFFSNYPSTQSHYRRRTYVSANQRQPQEQGQQPSLAFGLLLVIILMSMFLSLFSPDPVYSLSHSSKYNIRRQTQHLSVPYYVKQSFDNEYQGSLARLENSVEEDYVYTMKQHCFRERSYREAMMARARSFGSRAHFAQAQGLKMPSCDNLSKIGITRYSLY